MTESMRKAFLNPVYSDVSIVCGKTVLPAHRIVLCSQSKYFETACNGELMEGEGTIRLLNCDIGLVKKMLEFLYTGEYGDSYIDIKTEDSTYSQQQTETVRASKRTKIIRCQALLHAQMYAQGVYFQIKGLKAKAKEYFVRSFPQILDQKSFVRTIVEVYMSTAETEQELRELAVSLTKKCAKHRKLLKNNNDLLGKELLKAAPQFVWDLCVSSLAN